MLAKFEPITARQKPCKCCGVSSSLFGVVDFHKNCLQVPLPTLGLSGIPIYYYRCPACKFLFTTAFDDFTPEDFRTAIEKGDFDAIIMNYACHADVVCLSYAISADYPGAAARKVEEAFGNRVNCLFVNGAAGNVAPLFTVPRRTGPNDPFQTDYTPMERMGELLAYETVKVAKSLSGKTNDTTIKHQDSTLAFTGRFDPDKHFEVRLTTIYD
jgi:hypothetical protein